MQQSAAFKILKTRLKAVPSYSFNREQLNRMPSGDYYEFLPQMPDEHKKKDKDGDATEDGGSSYNRLNFTERLNEFQEMQKKHRVHTKSQRTTRSLSTSLPKVAGFFILRVDFISLQNNINY